MAYDSEDQELIPTKTSRKQFRMLLYVMLAIFLALATVFIVLNSIILVNVGEIGDDVEDLQQSIPEPYSPQPNYFILPQFSNVKNQGNRGTCWDFGTMRYVEHMYAQQGQRAGYLAANEFVRFSEQAYGKTIINYCKAHPKACPDTPQASGSATDGTSAWLYLFQDEIADKLVVEMSTCKYTPYPGSDEECYGYDDFVASSGIRYHIANHRVYYTVEEIKGALLKYQRPMLLTLEIYAQLYYVPCDAGLGYADAPQCASGAHLCPEYLQNADYSRRCAQLDRVQNINAEFALRSDRKRFLAAHVLLVTGFSERGLITMNSWGTQLSHSRRYLAGEISHKDDEQLCLNMNDPRRWVPVEHAGNDFYKLRGTTLLKYVEGGFQFGHIDISSRAEVAAALRSVCNESFIYAVQRFEDSVDGTVRAVLAYTQSVQRAVDGTFDGNITLPPMPIEALSYFFEPQGVTDQQADSTDECGYYLVEYPYIDATKRENGSFFVDDFDIVFEDSSYAKNMQSGFAREKVAAATAKRSEIPFKSATPWQDNQDWVPTWK